MNFFKKMPIEKKILFFLSMALFLNLLAMIYLFRTIIEKRNIEDNFISGLVVYFKFNNQKSFGEDNKFVYDFSKNGNNGKISKANWNIAEGKNNDGAFEFSSSRDSITVKDSDALSPSSKGLTVSYLVKFNSEDFIGEGSEKEYVNYLGKGSFDEGYEWLFRKYNSSNSNGRDNRISFYAFNSNGGLGAGSYIQDKIEEGEWIYLTGVINETDILLYKNGLLRSVNPLSSYNINIQNGMANFYIGKNEEVNYFKGSVDELRIYNRALNESEVKELYLYTLRGKNAIY